MSPIVVNGSRVRFVVYCLVLFFTFVAAESKAGANNIETREYPKSGFFIISNLSSVLPGMGCKVISLDKDKNTLTFVTSNKSEMAVRVFDNGKTACKLEITSSSTYSNELADVAAKVDTELSNVLARLEAQKAQRLATGQGTGSTDGDAPMVHCPKCGFKFHANGTHVGRIGGTIAGAGAGAYFGGSIGIVAGPWGGCAGGIPGAIIGGLGGLWAGGYYDNNKCPKCGHRFKE